MEHKKLIREIYSKKARNYRRIMENHPGFRELKREIARCVKTEKSSLILDLGTGTGYYGKILRGRVVGLDISREMLLEAGYEIELIEGDMEEIPIKNGIFDVVLCINAFRYSEDPEKMVLEVRRVMKPGGKFILVDGDRDNVEKRKEIMEKHPLEKILLGKEGIKKLYTSKEIKKFLEMHGFRAVSYTHLRAHETRHLVCRLLLEKKKPQVT